MNEEYAKEYYIQLSKISVTGELLFNNSAPFLILVDSRTISIILLWLQVDNIAELVKATYHSNSTNLKDRYYITDCIDVLKREVMFILVNLRYQFLMKI